MCGHVCAGVPVRDGCLSTVVSGRVRVCVCACVVCVCVNKKNEPEKEKYFIPLHVAKKARLSSTCGIKRE